MLQEEDDEDFYLKLEKMRVKAGKPRLYSEAFPFVPEPPENVNK